MTLLLSFTLFNLQLSVQQVHLLIICSFLCFLFLLFFLSLSFICLYCFLTFTPAGPLPSFSPFLVACYATLHPALSVRRSVGRLVGWSVGRSQFYFFFYVFAVFGLTAFCQMHSNSNTAPAHPHATEVAVYPALFHVT